MLREGFYMRLLVSITAEVAIKNSCSNRLLQWRVGHEKLNNFPTAAAMLDMNYSTKL